MDFAIFYITHLVEPYLAFCLTQSYFFPILFVVLWELLEYFLYTVTGNYSILFLETEDSIMESMEDILLYDIGGGILSVFTAYSLYSIFEIKDVVVKFEWSEWKMFLLFAVKVLIVSPFSAIGWECNETTSTIVSSLCPEDGKYQLFAWGLLAIIPINLAYIYYMFQDKPKQLYLALSYPAVVMLTAVQREIYGIVLSMWIVGSASLVFIAYWIYFFVKRRIDYRPL